MKEKSKESMCHMHDTNRIICINKGFNYIYFFAELNLKKLASIISFALCKIGNSLFATSFPNFVFLYILFYDALNT